jgi:hypothetical protein
MIAQFEQIGSRWQYLPRNLDRLSESDYRGMVKLISVSCEFDNQGKSDDQAYDDVTFVDFHLFFSFKTVLVFPVALKKELHNCFSFVFSLRVAAFASPGVNA